MHPSTFVDYLLEPDVESINFFFRFSNKIKYQMKKSEVRYKTKEKNRMTFHTEAEYVALLKHPNIDHWTN
jgi:hypothetical protein